ncbi:DUF4175 family protein [soil metagenome]
MSGASVLGRLRAQARRRVQWIAMLAWLPWLLPAAIVAQLLARQVGVVAWAVVLLPLAGLGWSLHRARGRIDDAWIARGLDAQRRDMEDSSALLHAAPDALPPLARLQRTRIAQRLAQSAPPDLRPRWPRWLPASAAAAIAVALLPVFATSIAELVRREPPPAATARPAAAPGQRLARISLEMTPPAYTGLPTTRGTALDARVPDGAQLRWSLQLARPAQALAFEFHDGSTLALQHRQGEWTGTRTLDRDSVYRVLVDGGTLDVGRWHRLVLRRDRPPQVQVRLPEHSLTVLDRAQTGWDLLVEASDDYGLGPARLELTLAQGTGENIAVSKRTLTLSGTGDARARRYRRRVDLGALGFAVGDDLVVRVLVDDARAPTAQTTRSASYILRWPAPPPAQASGAEGLVKRTLPAYFRSQRQIIIDTEALLAERPRLAAPTVESRSDAIGVDQRILRLRYGQFLGEESESGRKLPPAPAPAPAPAPKPNAAGGADSVTADAPAADALAADAHDDEHGDRHDGKQPAPTGGFGVDTAGVVADFSHTHDESEAATLLDPDTRALLKSALDAMWLAEGELRTAHPERALPHAYRALRLVKQVQQASRIYLARVGLELPPIDTTRRLQGKRAGIAPSRDTWRALPGGASPALGMWQVLAQRDTAPASRAQDAAVETFSLWLRDDAGAANAANAVADGGDGAVAADAAIAQRLALFEAFARWREDPRCQPCIAGLRAALWPLLPTAPAALPPRVLTDAAGRRYLDALSEPSP